MKPQPNKQPLRVVLGEWQTEEAFQRSIDP